MRDDGWRSTHKDPPAEGQKVYYFGPNIGLFIGVYSHEEGRSFRPYSYDESGERVYAEQEISLCPHLFSNEQAGTCDGCDAPYWRQFDEELASYWCPVIPAKFTTGLYD